MASLKRNNNACKVRDWLNTVIFPMVESNDISKGVRAYFRNEHDLHKRVIWFIRERFPGYVEKIIPGLGENQTSSYIISLYYDKGYIGCQPDITVLARQDRKGFNSSGFSIEFKSPRINIYRKMDDRCRRQVMILKQYEEKGFRILRSYDYGEITDFIGQYFIGCKKCELKCYICTPDKARNYEHPNWLRHHLRTKHTGVFIF